MSGCGRPDCCWSDGGLRVRGSLHSLISVNKPSPISLIGTARSLRAPRGSPPHQSPSGRGAPASSFWVTLGHKSKREPILPTLKNTITLALRPKHERTAPTSQTQATYAVEAASQDHTF